MPSGLRGGGYLLFHFRSIIGVARFNFSVRNGKRWSPCAIATLVRLQLFSVLYKVRVHSGKSCHLLQMTLARASGHQRTADGLFMPSESAGGAAPVFGGIASRKGFG